MGRTPTIPMKAWTIWHELITLHAPDALVDGSTWKVAAAKHQIPASRQAQAPYLDWLEQRGYIERIHGGFFLKWGDLDTSATSDGLFSTRPDGVRIKVLSAERVRELGLWRDEPEDEYWKPVFGFQFSTRQPGFGAYMRKKADYLRQVFPEPAQLIPPSGPPKEEPVAIEYLEDVHWYFLNDLGYHMGDVVDLDTWRLLLAHDFESVISDEHAREYHGMDSVAVFSEATYLAERLGLIKIETQGVRLRKAPRKTLDQPRLKSSAKNLVE